jgi:hypothetical protein
MDRIALAAVVTAAMLSPSCAKTARQRDARGAGNDTDAALTVPVLVEPTVVAFWLSRTDTLPVPEARQTRADFLKLAEAIARYLSDTDVRFVRTASDTVVVQLAGGIERTVMLSGLDFPYGFVLIDPGYAEEFHTGMDLVADLEDAIADYFGLDDQQRESKPRHRIAFSPGFEQVLRLAIHPAIVPSRPPARRPSRARCARRGQGAPAWAVSRSRQWSVVAGTIRRAAPDS